MNLRNCVLKFGGVIYFFCKGCCLAGVSDLHITQMTFVCALFSSCHFCLIARNSMLHFVIVLNLLGFSCFHL